MNSTEKEKLCQRKKKSRLQIQTFVFPLHQWIIQNRPGMWIKKFIRVHFDSKLTIRSVSLIGIDIIRWCINVRLHLVYNTTRKQFNQRNSEIVRCLETATHDAQRPSVRCLSASVYSSAAGPVPRIRWSELDFGKDPPDSALFINAAISGSSYQCRLAASKRHHRTPARDWNYTPEKNIKPRERRAPTDRADK